MSNRPTLSIITVTYNDAPALARTLDSLQALESIDWEHVIVDSSPELNAPVLLAHPLMGRRVHVTQPPRGIYAAMNQGIASARGEVLWLLNAGDRMKSAEGLVRALEAFRKSPDASMYVGVAELVRDGEKTYDQAPRIGATAFLGISRVCQQAILYRRDLFERRGTFSERYRLVADYEFGLRARYSGERAVAGAETLVSYDMSGASSNTDRAFAEFRQVHEDLARSGQLPHAWLHHLVRELERARVGLFRMLRGTRFGPWLRRLWYRTRR